MTRHVSVVGGHGSVARLLTGKLVERGHEVRGLVRSSNQFADLRADGAEPVLCDLENSSDDELDEALGDAEIVVFAAGAGPDSGPERKKTLDRDGAIRSVESAIRVGASRFVVVSSMGADDPPDDDDTFSVYLRAKHDADEAVRNASQTSGIGHVVVRPGSLTNDDGTGTVRIGDSVGRGEIPRADVAEVLAEIIDSGRGDGHTFEVISGDTAVRDAVRALD